jgi:beta-glucosidase
MSAQRLWEEYLPAYKTCIDAGARAVMPAFNDLNGVPCTVNEWLLRDVLRDEWGFDGITVSDANAIAECVNHGVVADRKAAAKEALQAGIDMDMTSNVYAENLTGLIGAGEVAVDLLDQAVYRILNLKAELGLFENPYQTDEEKEKATLVKSEYRALAREAATKSMVLLKNEGILPLNPQQKIAVFGALANDPGQMTGAWAIGAQENDCVSLVQAMEAQGLAYAYHPGIVDGSVAMDEINQLAGKPQARPISPCRPCNWNSQKRCFGQGNPLLLCCSTAGRWRSRRLRNMFPPSLRRGIRESKPGTQFWIFSMAR